MVPTATSVAATALFTVTLHLAGAAPAEDAVPTLPGFEGPLPSKHYSGYLPVGKETGEPGFLHYWLIESEGKPSEDPVTLWLNGGPGASSLVGLFTENGQVASNVNSLNISNGSVPTLFYNPYSWSQVANVLYLEQPKGVGFSYCADPEKCSNTDETTAQDAYEGLVHFFTEKFPEWKEKDFYITGESYAGTYIPMIMDVADKAGGLPNLKVGLGRIAVA
jgi:carboxypeptidase C (cathepsin A)